MLRILLIQPPVYDFAAYDFWLKPYGLLRVAGKFRGNAHIELFDYLDRQRMHLLHPGVLRFDAWGRGAFMSEPAPKPPPFSRIRRRYRRFGLPRSLFRALLQSSPPFDFALVQTMMTYWYPGVAEVVADLREFIPATRIVLGGIYTTLCPQHANTLGADAIVSGSDLAALSPELGMISAGQAPALWEAYPNPGSGVVKLTDGCPYRCSYCSIPQIQPDFTLRPVDPALEELEILSRLGVENVAFYDDALLFRPESVIMPFLDEVMRRGMRFNFHTPNALHARLVTRPVADMMVRAGFKTFYLGFESSHEEWQSSTGGKVYSEELRQCVDHLVAAGASRSSITAYLIIGHPDAALAHTDESMDFVHSLGIRISLSEFSPVPSTPDAEKCRSITDIDEPLCHNKTAFTIMSLGENETNRLKLRAKTLNRRLHQE